MSALAYSFPSTSAAFEKCEAAEQQKEAKQAAPKKPTVFAYIVAGVEAGRRSAKCSGVAWLEQHDDVLAVATVLLAIFTYRLVTGADAASHRQLRAYLGIKSMAVLPPNPKIGTTELVYVMQVRNFGQSPAFHVSISMTRKVLAYPLPGKYRFVEDPDADKFFGGASDTFLMLHPSGVVRMSSSLLDPFISQTEIARFVDSRDGRSGQTQLYCYGTIQYTDLFGAVHRAHYCYSFGGDAYKHIGRGSICHVYNDTTDDPQPFYNRWLGRRNKVATRIGPFPAVHTAKEAG